MLSHVSSNYVNRTSLHHKLCLISGYVMHPECLRDLTDVYSLFIQYERLTMSLLRHNECADETVDQNPLP